LKPNEKVNTFFEKKKQKKIKEKSTKRKEKIVQKSGRGKF